MRKPFLPAAVILLLAAGAAVYFLAPPEKDEAQSLHAYVSGAPVEIKVITPGPLKFIAPEGRKVKKGDPLLEVDISGLAQSVEEAEKAISERTMALPPATLVIFRGLSITPESAETIAGELEVIWKLHEEATELVTGLSVRHASLQLDLRRLELKQGRIAEDEERLKDLRLAGEKQMLELDSAKERRDEISARRSELEKKLRLRKQLETAFNNLPEEQKKQFGLVETEFQHVVEVEREIQDSRILSPEDGTIIKTFPKVGDEAFFGQTALLLASDGLDAFWITAIFSPETAGNIHAGQACSATLLAEEELTLPGVIAEPLPQAGSTAFKVVLKVDNAADLSRLQPRQEAVIHVPQGQ